MTNYIKNSVNEMMGYVPGEQPDDPDIVKLNTNENPYPPSPKVQEALSGLAVDRLRLYPNPVSQALRDRLAEIHNCQPEQVFIGNGSDEVLALCIRAFVEHDGAVGFFDPSYSLYPILAQIEQAATKPVPLPSDFGWVDPPENDIPLFFVTNPNAPTSLLFPKDRVRAFCERSTGVVLVDEAYVDFARESCLDLALELPNVLVARTLSKSFSLAGIRLGYAIGPAPLIEALHKIKDSYNVNRLTQLIALAAFSDLDYTQANIQKIRSTRDQTREALMERGWEVFPSDSNFLWAKPAGISATNVFDQLRELRILVRFFKDESTRDYLRITVGTDEEMEQFLNAVDRIMETA